jgi:3-hydroxyacyl-[acyl-carrier-protein] dehydratase
MNGRAFWTVPADHPAFAGHFPGRPIVPGVLLLDRVLALAMAGCDLAGLTVASAKFLSPVGPGETLEFSWRAGTGGVRFDIAAGDRSVATGLLVPLP